MEESSAYKLLLFELGRMKQAARRLDRHIENVERTTRESIVFLLLHMQLSAAAGRALHTWKDTALGASEQDVVFPLTPNNPE
jgi:hypothetical protein